MVPSAMANENYELHRTIYGSDWIMVSHSDASISSPRVGGKLVLQPNSMRWNHVHQTVPRLIGTDTAFLGPISPIQSWYPTNISSYDPMIALGNKALARFTGDVRKHNASLGMTIASWKKSREMIVDRSYKIADILQRRGQKVSRMTKWEARKILAQDTAGAFLEGEFGWVPLVKDIQDALGTLGRDPPEFFWVRRTARAVNVKQTSNANDPNLVIWTKRTFTERLHATVSGRVKVESQNLFLVNKLGLLNLPSVAWDLVPWSFVANMFGNFNQMISSMTDFAGLTINASSTTYVLRSQIDQWTVPNFKMSPPNLRYGAAWNSQFYTWKQRLLGLPSPTFQWRVPELSLETLLIAAALPLQRLKKIERILSGKAFGGRYTE